MINEWQAVAPKSHDAQVFLFDLAILGQDRFAGETATAATTIVSARVFVNTATGQMMGA